MKRKPYRIEIDYPKNRSPQYYLVKEVRIGDKHRKIKKYVGSGYSPPSPADVQKFCEDFAYEIELKAAQKKAEMSCALYKSHYLTPEQIGFLEEIRFIYQSFNELMTTNEFGWSTLNMFICLHILK